MEGLNELLEAIGNIVDFFVSIFKFIMSFFKSLGIALSVLLQMIPKIILWIATLPTWLLAFANISFILTCIYFVINRNTGKSD